MRLDLPRAKHSSLIGHSCTARLILRLNYSQVDFDAVCDFFVAAALAMERDEWW